MMITSRLGKAASGKDQVSIWTIGSTSKCSWYLLSVPSSSKHIKVCRIRAKYFFFPLTCSVGTGLRHNLQCLCLE